MNARQKLYFLLSRIEEGLTITPSEQPVLIHQNYELNRKYKDIELVQIFTKLERDEKVLSVVEVPAGINSSYKEFSERKESDRGRWHLKILPAFDGYYLKIQHESEYQKFTGKIPPGRIQILYSKIAEVDEQIDIRRKAFAQAQSYINDNPLYSEATRVGQLAKVDLQAQTDISNFINQKETYLKELSLRKSDIKPPSSTKEKYDGIISEIRKKTNTNSDFKKRYEDTLKSIKLNKKTSIFKKLDLGYDNATKTLKVKGISLNFKQDSFRAKLVELLFSKKGRLDKEWSWDEVLEEIEDITDTDLLKENKKRFYPACDGFSKTVAQKTGVNDLLVYTKSTVRVNPKYIVS